MRNYSSTAVATELAEGIDTSATSFTVKSAEGFPSVPFTLVIEPDTPYEEIVTVNARTGTSMTTVVRAQESTSLRAHAADCVVKHMVTARDLQEAQNHIAASNDVHGIGSTLGNAVVGTLTSQELENKSMSGSANNFTNIPQTAVTDLVANLSAKAPIASPTFTGTVTLPSTTSIGDVTAAELATVDTTSSIQTQLNSKQATITGAATTIDTEDLSINLALVSSASGKVAVSSVTATELAKLSGLTASTAELNYVKNVTSAIQTQLNNKQASDADLTAIAGVADNGILIRTGAGTAAAKKVAAGNGITVTNGDGVLTGDITVASNLVIKRGVATISLTADPSGNVVIDALDEYTGWSSAPTVTVTPKDSAGRYYGFVLSAPTTASATLGIRHYEGTSVTADIEVYWTAIGPA